LTETCGVNYGWVYKREYYSKTAQQRRNDNMGKRIQVARFGEDVPVAKAFEENADVRDVLDAYGITTAKGDTLSINGSPVTMKTNPQDGQCVYIAKSTSGS